MGILNYFDRFGETKNEVIILVVTSLILNFGFGVLIPFIPLYAQDLGASIGIVGIIIASFTIGRAIMSSFAGAYSDRIGRRAVILWGTLLYAVATGAMAFAPNWQALLVLRIVEGGAVGIVFPTALAYLVDIVPKDRVGEATGIYTTSFFLGFFVGPLLGSASYYITSSLGGSDLDALRSTFFVTAGMAVISLIVVYLKVQDFDPEYYTRKEEEAKANGIFTKTRLKLDNPQKEYKKYYVMTFFNGLGIGVIIPIFTIFFVDVHNFSEALVGVILGLSGGVIVLTSGPAGYFGDRFGRKILMIIGIPIMVINTAILGFASTLFIAALLFIFRAIGLSLFLPNFRALQADVVLPHERGKIFGRVQTGFNVGAVFGSILGAFVYQYMQGRTFIFLGRKFIGEATPFLLTGFFQSFMLVILFFFRYPSFPSDHRSTSVHSSSKLESPGD